MTSDVSLDPAVEAGLHRLYHSQYHAIHRFICARVPAGVDAEDLAAQTFLQACRAYDPQRSEVEAVSWLFQIARNVINDHWRHYYRSVPTMELTDTMLATVSQTETSPREPRAERQVQAILDALPARYRRVLELRYLQRASLQETALEMGVSLGNAKVLQYRALQRAAREFASPPDPHQPCDTRTAA